MKNIYTSILLLFVCSLFNYGFSQVIQGTIKNESPFVVGVYALSNGDIVANDFGFLVTLSIDANGSINISDAPNLIATSSIAGSVFVAPTEILSGRFVYAISLQGGALSISNGVELKIVEGTFSNLYGDGLTPTGDKKVQLNDYTADAGGISSSAYWYAELNGGDFTDYSTKFYGATAENNEFANSRVESLQALPITLKSFTAQKFTNNSVLLDWISSSEINSSHFDIQRSEDGEYFETIGTITAAGESSADIAYSFIDRDLNLRRNQTKIFYYRLNMIDLDASQEFSEIKAVRMTNEGYADVIVFPNPTAELLNIDIASDLDVSTVKMEITDIQGKRLVVVNIDISVQKIHTVNLKRKGLESGIYMVRLYTNNEVLSSQKIVLVSQ